MSKKLYLVEICLHQQGSMEPFAVTDTKEVAKMIMKTHRKGRDGIITEMELDKTYPKGIGVCEHQHYGVPAATWHISFPKGYKKGKNDKLLEDAYRCVDRMPKWKRDHFKEEGNS